MITRIWHGRTRREDADRYLAFLMDKGVKDYEATPGNLEVKIWRSMEEEEDAAHFWTVSVWENYECIEIFAGKDVSRAKYYPEDNEFLLEFELKVTHLETFKIK